MKLTHMFIALAPLSTNALACSGDDGPVNIGDGTPATLGQRLEDYEGSWSGYAEAYAFLDSSDRVRLDLDAQGQGVLVVGETPDTSSPGELPPGLSHVRPPRAEPGNTLFPGNQYILLNGGIDGGRIRFGINGYQPFETWCATQPSLLEPLVGVAETRHSCPGAWGGLGGPDECSWINPETGTREPIGCAEQQLCGSVCECTATGCRAGSGTVTATLDAVLSADGMSLEGSLAQKINDPASLRIRLTRE